MGSLELTVIGSYTSALFILEIARVPAHGLVDSASKPLRIESVLDGTGDFSTAQVTLEAGVHYIIKLARSGENPQYVLADIVAPPARDLQEVRRLRVDLRLPAHLAVSGRYYQFEQKQFSHHEVTPATFRIQAKKSNPVPKGLLEFYRPSPSSAVLHTKFPYSFDELSGLAHHSSSGTTTDFRIQLLKGEGCRVTVTSLGPTLEERSVTRVFQHVLTSTPFVAKLRTPTTFVRCMFKDSDGNPAPTRSIELSLPQVYSWHLPFSQDAAQPPQFRRELLRLPGWQVVAVMDGEPPCSWRRMTLPHRETDTLDVEFRYPPIPTQVTLTVTISILDQMMPGQVPMLAFVSLMRGSAEPSEPLPFASQSIELSLVDNVWQGAVDFAVPGGYWWDALYQIEWSNGSSWLEAKGTDRPVVSDSTIQFARYPG